MGLSLNIIVHELKQKGELWCAPSAAGEFEDVRHFLGSSTLTRDDCLYLCDNPDVPRTYPGYSFLYVSEATGGTARQAPPTPPASDALLTLAGPCPLSAVHAFLQDVFLKYRLWEEALDRSCVEDEGLQALLDLSTPFLRNNIVVVDPALKLLAHTKDAPCDDPVTVELIEHGYHTEENIRKFKLHKRFAPWATQEGFVINDSRAICKYVTVVHSFKTRNAFSLIVVMMCNEVDADDFLLDAFSLLLRRIAHYAKREYPEDKPAGNATDAFLRDLVNGSLDDEAIRERCESVGIPYEARFCLFYAAADAASAPLARLLADVARETAPAKVLLVDGAIVILCFNCFNSDCGQHCQSASCPLQRRAVSRRLDQLLDRYDLACGRSSRFAALPQTRIAFLQAKEAVRIGPRTTHDPQGLRCRSAYRHIFSFDRCCIDYLVDCGVKDGENLARMTRGCQVLSAIAEQDEANGTDNYRFLFQYLANERRMSLVAEKLHMHRNNVKYRIDRLEKTYGIDTSDPTTRFDLTLAYCICEADAAKPGERLP